ncbi:MAG: ATP-binding cassette domain-containing protein [Planctomycetaceae bacterium]|mgnify:CR=1 FL=1|jgi:ABC-2 type transport system ATP-binding protein|nr:ATP-binding cassette domain-containing protein [Planctomycetaceae bacterium]MBT6458798.1 ATP-binding cassette domain-containing protein [Planctomycetaceae bacterium]MBT6918755.1 ATP-binding cassette domain-containing protein [Planctomycetaceae bacterium]MBT7727791.1 ATP-binding cassette domain-containing protein [Planctomycetaceae bacterium]
MISLERVSVQRHGVIVLDQFTHTIHPGQSVAVIGPSGSGKTTLLETLAAILPVHSGNFSLSDLATKNPQSNQRLLGYVPDIIPIWPMIRVDECLELFASSLGLRGNDISNAVTRSLEKVSLHNLHGHRIDTLSSGQSKRLLLARALLCEPSILVFDNPYSGHDPAGYQIVEELVTNSQITGRIIVAAFNDANISENFTDLIVMKDGRKISGNRFKPELFTDVTEWQIRLKCPASAADAAKTLGHLTVSSTIVDEDYLLCNLATHRGPIEEALATLTRAGCPVATCTYDPPWPAQVLQALAYE